MSSPTFRRIRPARAAGVLALSTGLLLSGHPAASAATLSNSVSAVASVAPLAKKTTTGATPGNFTGYGFDQCVAPNQATMNKWLRHSPFLAVGIYISGDSRACRNQPNLSSTWVAKQSAKGWKVLPIALGPQASCQPRFPRYADDFRISATPNKKGNYGKARKQGVAEAAKNAADARAYGIAPGSTIWYDLEGFDLKNTACRESALFFVHGWVTAIEKAGYVSGFYSSAGSGIKMIDDARVQRPGFFRLPQQIWLADWDGRANTSSTYLRSDGWQPGGRMKQYRGGHNEKWGGATINIDSNFLDLGQGSVAARQSWCGNTRVDLPKYRRLATGTSRAVAVKALQCTLRTQGTYQGRINGKFNKRTATAVRTWQRSNTGSNGAWTRSHWVRLLATGNTPVLKFGSSGEAVYRIQRALNAAGPYRLAISGVFDSATDKALRGYQAKVRVKVSGVVNPATWRAFKSGRR